jgi:photosystem II stability/assembly factor-like uncharacterized protein
VTSPTTLPRPPFGPRLAATVTVAVFAMALLATTATATASSRHLPSWHLLHRGGSTDLRAIGPVNARVAWASGSGGTVLRTTDGGRTWREVGPPGTNALEFRGLEAFDAEHAVIMSVGNGPGTFRTYRTADGGAHWRLTNQNHNPQAFYDCMSFFSPRRGLILSDPVNGKFRILITGDGGRSWHVDPPRNLPPAHANEYGFAAGDSCITTLGSRDAWFGSGGPAGSRVFRSTDGGHTWTVAGTPIMRGPSAGIFSVAFRTRLDGLAIGGDFAIPGNAPRALALTHDGGRTWTLVGRGAPGEYRSGATWIPHRGETALAVGLTGSDVSTDSGHRWRRFDTGSFDAVACRMGGACWASGAHERIARLA